jgi:transposase-like protein
MSFLLEHNIIYNSIDCIQCGHRMKRETTRFRCTDQTCRSELKLLHGSFFAGTKLKPTQVLLLGYLWLTRTPFNLACTYIGGSRETVSSFYQHYRQLTIDSLDIDDDIIGGQNVIVEIDESKFGKRKYNRGHRVEGCWVLGGVERTEARKLFITVVQDRTAQTLLNVIQQHVKPGSIIYTDLWKGYSKLNEELGYSHFTVNHSLHFKDPITGVDTNTIEGTWNGIKMTIAPRARNSGTMDERLLEFIWRRKHADDPWNGLIESFKISKYI